MNSQEKLLLQEAKRRKPTVTKICRALADVVPARILSARGNLNHCLEGSVLSQLVLSTFGHDSQIVCCYAVVVGIDVENTGRFGAHNLVASCIGAPADHTEIYKHVENKHKIPNVPVPDSSEGIGVGSHYVVQTKSGLLDTTFGQADRNGMLNLPYGVRASTSVDGDALEVNDYVSVSWHSLPETDRSHGLLSAGRSLKNSLKPSQNHPF